VLIAFLFLSLIYITERFGEDRWEKIIEYIKERNLRSAFAFGLGTSLVAALIPALLLVLFAVNNLKTPFFFFFFFFFAPNEPMMEYCIQPTMPIYLFILLLFLFFSSYSPKPTALAFPTSSPS
jgi:hypothetical protein